MQDISIESVIFEDPLGPVTPRLGTTGLDHCQVCSSLFIQ
jgi:hypothetical protein